MLPSAEVLSQILEALYEAPLQPSRWEKFLRLTANAIGGEAAALLLHDFSDSQSLVARQWGIDPEATRRYQEHYSGLDVWLQGMSKIEDWLGTSEQFVPFAELKRTEFYNDLVLPFGIPHGIFGMVERSPSRVATLSIYRSLREGAFQQGDLHLLRFLKPHINRAYRLHSKLASARNHSASLQSALDSLTMPVILLAPKARVVTMNRAAEQILIENDGLVIRAGGLQSEHIGECAQLQKLVAEATSTSTGTGVGPAGVMTVSRHDRPSLQLLVSPIRGVDMDEAHPVRAIVFIGDPTQRVRPAHDTLRLLFKLTPAECRFAMLLTDGHSPVAIAEKIGVSRNTLKSQLASIFRKTGTSRQPELVRLLLQLPGTSPSTSRFPV